MQKVGAGDTKTKATPRRQDENTNPAFAGRDLVSVQGEINTGDVLTKPATSPSHEFVSAQGEIDTDGATTNSATSPNSDKATIPNPNSPVNSNYRD